MRFCIALYLIFLITGCATTSGDDDASTVVLKYEDFGPQIIAHQLIGMYWWQWDDHGYSRPINYDINVVVYKKIHLQEVANRYPINQSKNQDYRYVKYKEAIEFLHARINENIEPSVTQRLEKTLKIIQEKLGDNDS